jgi:hypothetical protein
MPWTRVRVLSRGEEKKTQRKAGGPEAAGSRTRGRRPTPEGGRPRRTGRERRAPSPGASGGAPWEGPEKLDAREGDPKGSPTGKAPWGREPSGQGPGAGALTLGRSDGSGNRHATERSVVRYIRMAFFQ